MNKTLLLSIVAFALAGVVIIAFWLIGVRQSQVEQQSGPQPVGLPVAGSINNPSVTTTPDGELATSSFSGTTMLLKTAGGSSIQTNNFIADQSTTKDPINAGYYYLGYHVYEGVQDATATIDPPYIIEYIAATQYFNIALLQEPIGSTRSIAEKYLMGRLGILPEQMCKLDYMVSVPEYVNSQFAGRDLRFSFCPGATKLPQ